MDGYYFLPYTLLNFINFTKCWCIVFITENITEINNKSSGLLFILILQFFWRICILALFSVTSTVFFFLCFKKKKSSLNFVNPSLILHPKCECCQRISSLVLFSSFLIMSSTSYFPNFSSQLWIYMFCSLLDQSTHIQPTWPKLASSFYSLSHSFSQHVLAVYYVLGCLLETRDTIKIKGGGLFPQATFTYLSPLIFPAVKFKC